MKTNIELAIKEEQKKFVHHVLTLAEITLNPNQFKVFKQLVFKEFYTVLAPKVSDLLRETKN